MLGRRVAPVQKVSAQHRAAIFAAVCRVDGVEHGRAHGDALLVRRRRRQIGHVVRPHKVVVLQLQALELLCAVALVARVQERLVVLVADPVHLVADVRAQPRLGRLAAVGADRRKADDLEPRPPRVVGCRRQIVKVVGLGPGRRHDHKRVAALCAHRERAEEGGWVRKERALIKLGQACLPSAALCRERERAKQKRRGRRKKEVNKQTKNQREW